MIDLCIDDRNQAIKNISEVDRPSGQTYNLKELLTGKT
jgi:hypothetical protein